MAYATWSVVFGEQPTASKWNTLGTNDASFADGTALPSAGMDVTTLASTNTANTSYEALDTPTSLSITIGATGKALVIIAATLTNSIANGRSLLAYAKSGANTSSSADGKALAYQAYGNGSTHASGITIGEEGLTPGSTTYTLQQKVSAGTGSFSDITFTVVPL